MIIRHNLPYKGYTKIDRNVFTKRNLSDGAKVLYGFLCGLKNGSNFSDTYITKAMELSDMSLYRRKKELIEADLLLVDRVSPKMYIAYIGYTKYPASQVKKYWTEIEDAGKLGEK